MAKWNVRIKKKLKAELNILAEGVYIDADMFDDFVSWLRAKEFKELVSDELKENGLLSPDGKWLIIFRQTRQGFVFVQLTPSILPK